MKSILLSLVLALAFVGCSSMSSMNSGERLALYKANAGAPVSSFRYFGQLDSWEELGDDALAVWTRPREAWLLELSGPCNGLAYSPVIGLTDQFGRVQAGFDNVLVRDPSAINIPCRIHTIRPLDVTAIRQAEQAARAQASRASSGNH